MGGGGRTFEGGILAGHYGNNNNNNNNNNGTYVWMVILHVAVEVETVMWLPSHCWMQFGPVQKNKSAP